MSPRWSDPGYLDVVLDQDGDAVERAARRLRARAASLAAASGPAIRSTLTTARSAGFKRSMRCR